MSDVARLGQAASTPASDVPFPEYSSLASKLFPPQGPYLRQENGYYIFKGMNGIPFRSKRPEAPHIKANDPIQPTIVVDMHARVFDLSIPEDLQAYIAVWNAVSKGWYTPPLEERQWVPEQKNWKVFMRWGVRYWELPVET